MTNFNVKYVCNSCGKTTMRSIGGWDIECSCGGIMTSCSDYNYICASCGNSWTELTDRTKQCTNCHSRDIVIQYNGINTEIYNDIQKNVDEGKRYAWKCASCGETRELYSNKIYNVACTSECESTMECEPSYDVLGKLEEYRKKNHLTQAQFAEYFKISRCYYTLIVSGKKPVPLKVMKYIKGL